MGWLGLRALRRPRSAGPQGKVPLPEGVGHRTGPARNGHSPGLADRAPGALGQLDTALRHREGLLGCRAGGWTLPS